MGGCWLAMMQARHSKVSMSKLLQDLENLQRAEDQLTDMQKK